MLFLGGKIIVVNNYLYEKKKDKYFSCKQLFDTWFLQIIVVKNLDQECRGMSANFPS